MKKLFITILISCFSVQSFACDIPEAIKKGDKSPCDGYVMSVSTEEKIRTDLAYKDALIKNLTTRSTLQDELIKIQSKEVELYREQMNKDKTLSTAEKALYFTLGAVLTGVVAYGTVQALR